MLTPHQIQIARRLHHATAHQPPRQLAAVPAEEIQALLRALWFAVDENERLNKEVVRLRVARAEKRMEELGLGSD